jgi:hypothetical protein
MRYQTALHFTVVYCNLPTYLLYEKKVLLSITIFARFSNNCSFLKCEKKLAWVLTNWFNGYKLEVSSGFNDVKPRLRRGVIIDEGLRTWCYGEQIR